MNKIDIRSRAQILKDLRVEHEDTVKRTQALLKSHKRIHREICQSIRDTPKTVPEIAAAVNIPTHEILWHITALKKYDVVAEEGMCGEYPMYTRTEEA